MISFNSHKPVLIDEIKKYISKTKKINVIDATFGGGGYSKELLENYNVGNLIAIDRDPISRIFAKNLKNKYKNFTLINGCFSKIDEIIRSKNKKIQFDFIIFDLGLSSNQLDDDKRGFSFMNEGPLDMNMGEAKLNASDIINNFSEKKLSDIFFEFGDEKFAFKIAKRIVKLRKIKMINSTLELSKIINESVPLYYSRRSKINPATKTFQALRIYVNDELEELKTTLKKCIKLLNIEGKILVVSFHSLEDKIVKDFFNHESGKRWRSSRHYPELADKGPITFKLITKKPIRPEDKEIRNNPRSRSAKLRIVQKIN